MWIRSTKSFNRPLSRGGHFESQGNKKLCFCTSSLALNERLDVQNLLFEHCVIKVYTHPHRFYLCTPYFKPKHACAVKPEVLISWTLEIDYSIAPCLGADQKTRALGTRLFPDRKLNDPRTGAHVPGRETDSTAKSYEWRHETSMGRYVFYQSS